MDYYEFYFSGEDLEMIRDVTVLLKEKGVEHPRREMIDSIFIERLEEDSLHVHHMGVDYWVDMIINEREG